MSSTKIYNTTQIIGAANSRALNVNASAFAEYNSAMATTTVNITGRTSTDTDLDKGKYRCILSAFNDNAYSRGRGGSIGIGGVNYNSQQMVYTRLYGGQREGTDAYEGRLSIECMDSNGIMQNLMSVDNTGVLINDPFTTELATTPLDVRVHRTDTYNNIAQFKTRPPIVDDVETTFSNGDTSVVSVGFKNTTYSAEIRAVLPTASDFTTIYGVLGNSGELNPGSLTWKDGCVGIAKVPGSEALEVSGNILAVKYTSTSNTLVGNDPGHSITSGTNNIAIGLNPLYSITTSNNYIGIGTNVGTKVTDADTTGPVFIGNEAGRYGSVNRSCVYIGHMAGKGVDGQTGGSRNTCIGTNSMLSVTTASDVTCVGTGSGYSITTGSYNTCVGVAASSANITGADNTCVGYKAGYAVKSNYNIAIGSHALELYVGDPATDTDRNTVIGAYAGSSWTSGSENVCIGTSAGRYVTTPSKCVFIGDESGSASGTATNQVVVGAGSKPAIDGTGVIVLGTQITGSGSNSINIGCGNSTAANSINIGTMGTHTKVIIHSLAASPNFTEIGAMRLCYDSSTHEIYTMADPYSNRQTVNLSMNDYLIDWFSNTTKEVCLVTASKTDGTSKFDMFHPNSTIYLDNIRYTIINYTANYIHVGCSDYSLFDGRTNESWCGYVIPPYGWINTVCINISDIANVKVVGLSPGAVWEP